MKTERGEMERRLLCIYALISFLCIAQSFVTACPTCLHGASIIHQSEDVIGEMEVFHSTDNETHNDDDAE